MNVPNPFTGPVATILPEAAPGVKLVVVNVNRSVPLGAADAGAEGATNRVIATIAATMVIRRISYAFRRLQPW